MPISTTDTTLTLTGPEDPIASLTINGDVINFTAYDGTLESTTAGTPYTLSLNGFANQGDAFIAGSVTTPTLDLNLLSLIRPTLRATLRDTLRI